MPLYFIPAIAGLWLSCTVARGNQPIVIHEWGTFTSLQNERGEAIGGINVDTELLPPFVHNFAAAILPNEAPLATKGMPTTKPRLDVTMRLETPVIYFHLPADAQRPAKLDLSVRFRDGWLTQFYPDAAADIDGQPVTKMPQGPIIAATKSRSDQAQSGGGLAWRDLQVGVHAQGPVTKSHVWLAPRQARSDAVTTLKGESESYLFYRGVGRVDAPLRISWPSDSEIEIQAWRDTSTAYAMPMIGKLWLVDVQSPDALAYRTVDLGRAGPDKKTLTMQAGFRAEEHSANALNALKGELQRALVADGLFDDEANALLSTWEISYFKLKGLRAFFLVPREWTDAHLPITVSASATLKRTMVGRIELVTPTQRKTLRDLAAVRSDLPDKQYFNECGKLYSQLGRFANALLLEEQRTRPRESLDSYVRRAQLNAYKFPGIEQVRAR